jgi:hypothetical protein
MMVGGGASGLGVPVGTVPVMTSTPDDDMVERRKQLMPDEREAGSDDPEAQAEAILEESEERTLHPEETRHESTQTPDDNRPG